MSGDTTCLCCLPLMQLQRIDILTREDLTYSDGSPQLKSSENNYLETWLDTHGIEADVWVAKFYADADADTSLPQQRLEAEGKVLVFTNGADGYFTDPDTTALMTEGDASRHIQPLFAHDATSPHNRVAYGSLIASDGIRSTTVPQSRILVIDDETRDFGAEFLLDRNGNPISPDDTAALLDKMGDGTMLISTGLMQNLITEDEIERISAAEFDKAGISDDITQLDDIDAVDAAQQTIDKRVQRLVHSTVTQFRAATPDLPGMAKGTMTTSRWADRLGVDAIISTNDIKGDDGRLSSPGFKAVSRFWVNRKSDARYGLQSVGPQVKGTIPDATRVEFNPRMKKQAEQLAGIAAQPSRLMDLYIQQRERRVASTELDETQSIDWLYEIGKTDEKGLLTGFSKINRKLDRFLRGRRVDVATHGIEVPSAMAQHHSQLKPWEVCNKSLPDGAVVAYYRSPFPNVGAAAIGINTHRAIKDA
ncbi:MAG: hypothetical protein AAFQ57_12325, partial [Cyanobacteria bacterium J06626_14]